MRRFQQSFSTFGRLAGGLQQPGSGRLRPVADLGDNPGELLAWSHVPANLAAGAALVVVLHGCTQDAAAYDRGSGWSALADEQGFALLYPEQQRSNNPNLCFNWFRPGDSRRGRGEAQSIRAMIAHMIERHGLDPKRVFVTGLSAGGAMTSAMLATYPELFAGGAVIAGLPFAVANSVPEALGRMRSAGEIDGAVLGELVAEASSFDGPWPTLSVWHGSADATVSPDNGEAIVEQWRGLHGAPKTPAVRETVDGQQREVWRDSSGRDVIERYVIAGLGHGTPLGTRGSEGNGAAGPHMLEAGINSTRRIASFWELVDVQATAAAKATVSEAGPKPAVRREAPVMARRVSRLLPPAKLSGVAEVIDKALRSAGLLR